MTEQMIPMIIVPLSFLFVLLIILVVKAPKVGAWIIGGLVLLVPFLLYRCVMAGGFRHDEEVIIPLVVVPAAFLFVLMIILLNKAPKAGAGLLVALVVMGVFGVLVLPGLSHRAAHVRPVTELIEVPAPRLSPMPTPPKPVVMSPIWSEGVEKEFDADIYPSRLAAIQAVGRRMDKAVRELIGDVNTPVQITLFQEVSEAALMVGLRNAIQQAMPQGTCTIEADLRNLRPGEVGVTMMFSGMQTQPAPWARSSESRVIDGTVHVHIFTMSARVMPQRQFVEMPWVENFAAFTSGRPEQAFIVTRSQGTCTSESEAHQQALDDTRARLTEALGRRPEWQRGGLPEPAITSTDVLQGGFIVDRFTQSFDGSAGKIWRQALLIDVSGPKLSHLADQKAQELHAQKMSWARMGFSVIGVLVLIGVIYFFLNAATMGYYEWSLRIAGVVLAIVAIISILMVVQ